MGSSAGRLWGKTRTRHRSDGTTEYFATEAGYTLVFRPQHPMATKWGWARDHRVVLYDAIGPGPHSWWSCGVEVDWGGHLVVHHLDHDRSNNTIENLAPSCTPCNARARGVEPVPDFGSEDLAPGLDEALNRVGDPWLLDEPLFSAWLDSEYERLVEDPKA